MPTQEAYASHVVGGDITYVCLGGNTYRIMLTVRRDCYNGDPDADFDDPASVAIYALDGTLLVDFGDNGELFLPFMGDDTIVNDLDSNCGLVGSPVCVHESRYMGEVELDFRPEGYLLVYQRCCRNITLNNIIDPTETGSTYSIELTEAGQSLCNSAPSFLAWPEVYLCAGQDLIFDHSAIDADGDSLVYRLCTPSTGATFDDPRPQPANPPPYADVTWEAGFSLNNLLGSGTPLSIDPVTGILTARPDDVGQYLVGVCVEEYRDGVKISELKRDFEYNTRLCIDPVIAEVEPIENNCDTLGFSFVRGMNNNGDNWEWIIEDADGNVILNLMNADPDFTFPGEGIYTVTLIETRDVDMCEVINSFEIPVFDRDYLIDFEVDIISCTDDLVDLSLMDLSTALNPGENIIAWNWTVISAGTIANYSGPSVNVSLPDVSTVIILEVVFETTCTLMDTIVFDESLLPQLSIQGYSVECDNSNTIVSLYTEVTNNPTGLEIDTYSWLIFDGQDILNFDTDTVYVEVSDIMLLTASLDVVFENGCTFTVEDLTNFPIDEQEVIIDASVISCQGDSYEIVLNSELSNPAGFDPTGYSWVIVYGGQTINSTDENPVLDVAYGDNLMVTATIFISQDCSVSSIIEINIDEELVPNADFGLDLLSCPTEDSFELQIVDLSTVPMGAIVMNPLWSISINGSLNTYTDLPPVFTVNLTDELIIGYSFDISDMCSVSTIDTIDLNNILPDPSFTYTLQDCSDPDGEVVIEFTNTSVLAGANVSSVEWTYMIDGSTNVFTGDPLVINTEYGEEISISLEVSFDNNCTISSDSATIIVVEEPVLDVEIAVISCDLVGDDYLIGAVATIAGGYTPENVTWDILVGQDSYMLNGDTISFPASMNALITMTVSAELGPNCILTETFEFNTEDALPIQNIGLLIEDCDADIYEATILDENIISSLTPIDSSVWIVELNGVSTTYYSLPQDITLLPTDILTVTNFLYFGNGCVQEYTEVFDASSIQLDITAVTPFEMCVGDTIRYTIINNDTLQTIEVQWEDDPHILEGADSNAPLITFLPGETSFTLTALVTNQYGCDSTVMVTFELGMITEQMSFIYTTEECGETTICFENTNQFAYSFLWDFGVNGIDTDTSTLANVCYTYPGLGEYTVTLSSTDSVCAPLPISETILLDVLPELNSAQDTVVNCEGGSISLSATSNILQDSIMWFNADGEKIGQGPFVTVMPDGEEIYTATLVDAFGCGDTLSFVTQVSNVEVEIEAEANFIYLCDTIELFIVDPKDNETYMWSNGDEGESILVNPIEDTQYMVTVTDEFGCTATAEFLLEVTQPKCDETDVFIPNAFSPNGDDVNDVLFVRSNFIKEMRLIIYNRWGEQIFVSADQSRGWDGTYLGEELPPDAYGYSLMVVCPNDLRYTAKGNVSIIR